MSYAYHVIIGSGMNHIPCVYIEIKCIPIQKSGVAVVVKILYIYYI